MTEEEQRNNNEKLLFMKISLEKYLVRAGSNALRRLTSKRPWLGLLLIGAAAAFLYFKPHLPDLPFPGFPEKTADETPAGISKNIAGRVSRVADGDSLTLKTADGEVKIRLFGLDAPEMKQSRGRESKKYLARLVSGREVRVEVKERDQYGRVVGRVFVQDQAVDLKLVVAGQVWVYENYCRETFCGELRRLQEEARQSRRGLWRDNDPKPPWVWRQENPRR